MVHPPVVVVNEKDEVVGAEKLAVVWQKGLYHRIVRIMAEDPAGSILLQRRSSAMKLYPNCWDHSAAGHVDEGDSYEQAAVKELREELGVHDTPLHTVATYRTNGTYQGRILNRFNRLFTVQLPADAPVTIEPTEVSEVRWFTRAEIHELVREHPDQVTWDLAYVMRHYFPL